MRFIKGLVGTYSTRNSQGVYAFTFDTENQCFQPSTLYVKAKEAKYLSYDNGRLVFPVKEEKAKLCMIRDGKRYEAGEEDHTACYVLQDASYAYSVNYHDGTLIRYIWKDDTFQIDKQVFIQKEAGCHQVILLKDTLLVPCRQLDRLYVFDRKELTLLQAMTFPKDSGIRHGVSDPFQQHVYLLSENSCEIFDLDMANKGMITRRFSLLKDDEPGQRAGGALRISQDGRYLYASVRGVDRIYVVDTVTLTTVQVISSGGKHPRDIALSPHDDYLFSANKDSDNLVVFKRDPSDGQLVKVAETNDIPEGVSIVFTE